MSSVLLRKKLVIFMNLDTPNIYKLQTTSETSNTPNQNSNFLKTDSPVSLIDESISVQLSFSSRLNILHQARYLVHLLSTQLTHSSSTLTPNPPTTVTPPPTICNPDTSDVANF